MDDTDLNKHVASFAESEPLYGIPYSIDDARLEMAMGNSRNRNSALIGSPSSSGQDNPWPYLCNIENGFISRDFRGDLSRENDQILLRAREDFAMQNMRRSSVKHIGRNPDGIAANLRVNGGKIVSYNELSTGRKQTKAVSRANLSQFAKKPVNDKAPVYDSVVVSSMADGIIRSNPEANSNGTNFREWLKSKAIQVEKVEKLQIFRQIVHLVDFAHSQGSALQDLRPSCFSILPSNKIQYNGSLVMREAQDVMVHDVNKKKRTMESDPYEKHIEGVKQQKLSEAARSLRNLHRKGKGTELYAAPRESQFQKDFSHRNAMHSRQQQSIALANQLEKTWYTSPEELDERGCSFSSNVYGLGILLFELLCCFESWEAHSALMLDLRHRIIPGKFLSENPIESAFCLWLLHPESASRPTTREILQSELLSGSQDSGDVFSNSADCSDPESELLLKFFDSLKEEEERRALKLMEDIRCLEEDIKEVERKYSSRTDSVCSREANGTSEEGIFLEESSSSDLHSSAFTVSGKNKEKLMKNITQLENAYFYMRSQIRRARGPSVEHRDKYLQNKQEKQCNIQNKNEDLAKNQASDEPVGAFFDGLCKFSRFSKFKVCGTLRNGDLFNSTNAICSLSFDCNEEFIAAAKVSKKIKIFEFDALSNDSIDIHYPVIEMSNKSKLSCICWNYYIRNYLASTDYDGVVKMWDASTGEGFAQFNEHQKRAWSVDFSRADPTMFASGSDDCSVRLWSVNDKNSIGTIWSPANVCCVQFSEYSNHQLVFGSADYKIYGYDLRHVRAPLCTLSGHTKAVSYVKFLDPQTLVSASTDNTLKLWNLKQDTSDDKSCSLSFTGHTNEKNFVGLSVLDGYIVCGSETNEVYSYYKSLPMPITSYKFGSIDPVSGHEISDDSGQFVSSVCWRRKSNTVVAANSSGILKLLKMV